MWTRINALGAPLYLIGVGLVLLAGCWLAVSRDSDATAASLAILGGGSLLLVPFLPVLEGKIRIGPLVMTLRERVVAAAVRADAQALEGVAALLESDEVTVVVRPLAGSLAGHRLTDPELEYLRKELNLSAVAAKFPGEERWRGGGALSALELPAGTELLLAGPRASIDDFDLR